MHIHMLSSQNQSSKTAFYITFRISHQQWQKHIFHHITRICIIAWTHTDMQVCLSIFLWCETAGSNCPVFPFPLWLITRVPVNPWYHHRIKRRPPSPREPISSESRTQTEKLLDIFAGPGMVKTSGRKDAPWHHPAAGSLHFTRSKPRAAKKTQAYVETSEMLSFRRKRYWTPSTSAGIRGRRSEIGIAL